MDYKDKFVALLKKMERDGMGGAISCMIAEGLAEVDNTHTLSKSAIFHIDRSIHPDGTLHAQMVDTVNKKTHVILNWDGNKLESVALYDDKGNQLSKTEYNG